MIALALLGVINSQNQKGNWLVGVSIGSVGFNNSKSTELRVNSNFESWTDGKSFTINLTPYAGYYFTDKIVAGALINLGLGNSTSESRSSISPNVFKNKSNTIIFEIGPFGRFYFGKLNNRGMPFAEANFQVGFYPKNKSSTYTNGNLNTTYTYESYLSKNAGTRIGYEHFLNRHIGLQYTVGFSYTKYSYKVNYDYVGGTDASYEESYRATGITAGLGLVIHLERKQKSKKK